MRRLVLLAVLAVCAGGCRPARPTLAGGRPVSYWVEALRGPDAGLRKKAALKLGNVGPGDPAVLPALLGALKDEDAAVRREAIVALMKCGPAARAAIPALTEIEQSDPDPQARADAARALRRFRGG